MSYPHRVAKITLSGDMFNGTEVWSTGFYMGFEGADAADITDQGLADIGEAWKTFFTNSTSMVSARYTFKMVKGVMLNNDGGTMSDTAKFWSPATAVSGGAPGTAVTPPPQVSLVCSLQNSLPRGLATKGRLFLPGITAVIDTTGHLNTADTTNIATNMKTFFDAITNDADTPGNPVLASKGRPPLLLGGAIRNVNSIRVGNVYDTQRRRRNALVETYISKTLLNGS